MAWITQHKLLFGLIIVLVAGGVWYGLSSGGTPATLTTQTLGTGSPTSETADQQLVGSLLALRAVTLNGTIFSDAAFMSLQDFGTTIVPEPVGRPNPFEAIATSSVSQSFAPRATTTTQTQQTTPLNAGTTTRSEDEPAR